MEKFDNDYILKRMNRYQEIVSKEGITDLYIHNGVEVIKVFGYTTESLGKTRYDVEVLMQRNMRTYTDPSHDEGGWAVENGEFFEKEYIRNVPDIIFSNAPLSLYSILYFSAQTLLLNNIKEEEETIENLTRDIKRSKNYIDRYLYNLSKIENCKATEYDIKMLIELIERRGRND